MTTSTMKTSKPNGEGKLTISVKAELPLLPYSMAIFEKTLCAEANHTCFSPFSIELMGSSVAEKIQLVQKIFMEEEDDYYQGVAIGRRLEHDGTEPNLYSDSGCIGQQMKEANLTNSLTAK
ncbi:hypothetical protein V6N13_020619 [Hibiscus sabdariffa]